MKIQFGKGQSKYGTGVQINLTGNEVATAISAYLVSHAVIVRGARTITVNGKLCEEGEIYIDPSGFAIADGVKYLGKNKNYTSL